MEECPELFLLAERSEELCHSSSEVEVHFRRNKIVLLHVARAVEVVFRFLSHEAGSKVPYTEDKVIQQQSTGSDGCIK